MGRGLRRYLATATCARLADDGMAVAVTLLALHRTGSAAQGAGVLAAWMAPHAVAAPLTGALAARAGARARGGGAAFHAVALGVFAAAIAGVALTLGRAPVPVVLAIAALGGCCGPMVTGGLSSVLAGLVSSTEARARAYALDAATYNAAGIAAPAAVTAAAGLWGAGPATATLAAAATGAAVLATTLRAPRRGAAGPEPAGGGADPEGGRSRGCGAGGAPTPGEGERDELSSGQVSGGTADGRPPEPGGPGPEPASVAPVPQRRRWRLRPRAVARRSAVPGTPPSPSGAEEPGARANARTFGAGSGVASEGPGREVRRWRLDPRAVVRRATARRATARRATARRATARRATARRAAAPRAAAPRAAALRGLPREPGGAGPGPASAAPAPEGRRWRLRPRAARPAAGLARRPVDPAVRRPRRSALRRPRRPAVWPELLDGLQVLWRVPALRRITAATSLAFVGVGGLAPAAVLLADARGYPGGGGVLLTVLAAGALAGALAAARRPPGFSAVRLAAGCLVGTGGALLGAAAAAPYPLCVALFAAAGLCDGPLLAATLRIRADHAPPAARTQVFTLGAGLKTTAGAAGAALTAAAASALAPSRLLVAVAVLQFAGAALLREAPRSVRPERGV